MEQRNEAQRLGIGEGKDEEAQKFTQGKGGVNFAQCTIHPCIYEIVVVSNGNNSWFLRVGNAG